MPLSNYADYLDACEYNEVPVGEIMSLDEWVDEKEASDVIDAEARDDR